MDPSPAQRAALDKIAAELAAAAGPALPGTLTVRAYACGKPDCRCHADPPALHGPYAEWTRKIDGKTITRRLTDDQLADWQPLFDNARKIRDPARRTPGPHPRRSSTPAPRASSHNPEPRQNDVGTARLTRGPHPGHATNAQLTPKREDLSRS